MKKPKVVLSAVSAQRATIVFICFSAVVSTKGQDSVALAVATRKAVSTFILAAVHLDTAVAVVKKIYALNSKVYAILGGCARLACPSFFQEG